MKFEPVWVSLRPVPRITLDFGNGNVVRRTLHGNIATWVCAADGTALDVLPGIYETEKYAAGLLKLESLHYRFSGLKTNEQRVAELKRYHGLEILAETSNPVTQSSVSDNKLVSRLAHDSRWNESVRRTAIHRHLKDKGLVQPDQVTKWMYRELLNADLDDPWLGLGDALFGNYPFMEEDSAVTGS